jgi:hypothetical protein
MHFLFFHTFGRFGSPAHLTSDRGSYFIANVIEEFLRHVGTQYILTLSYSKEENAIVEQTNKEVNRHLRALTFDKNTVNDYRLYVPIVQRNLNSSYNERTWLLFEVNKITALMLPLLLCSHQASVSVVAKVTTA